ncbi:MAG: hypothetical protein ACRDPY_35195 [Streptosporangiaceae bacterium]
METAPSDECEDLLVLADASRAARANTGEGVTPLRADGAPCAAAGLRDLAAAGELRQAARSGDARGLRSEAFAVVLPLVWQRHTRPLEMRKGHRRCAAEICCLEPECADGFTDDVESVVTALLAYGRPIANLEGWITTRMANAIKDGYRMRRSRDMGAQQRVRVPIRLKARLGNDPWMVALAHRVLQWTGVRYAAGTQMWPLGAWAEDRAALAGPACEPSAGETVAADLAVLLRIMREWDAIWYVGYVEQPLGRKWAPVAAQASRDADCGAPEEPAHLDLVPQHERDDARLAEAAAECLTVIRSGIAAGGEPRQVVAEALVGSFLSVDSLCEERDRTPFADGDPGIVVAAVLADPDALDRVVGTALDIVA